MRKKGPLEMCLMKVLTVLMCVFICVHLTVDVWAWRDAS